MEEENHTHTPEETTDTALRILHRYWQYPQFRGVQREIIDSVMSGRDTLGLMPTGGGKSLTFQVPALMLPGVTLVVTPLIALMKDQVSHLRHRGIQASAIYSGMTHADILQVLDNAVLGGVKLLYISPERIGTDLFQKKLRHMQVSLITVDEAHCISQWAMISAHPTSRFVTSGSYCPVCLSWRSPPQPPHWWWTTYNSCSSFPSATCSR